MTDDALDKYIACITKESQRRRNLAMVLAIIAGFQIFRYMVLDDNTAPVGSTCLALIIYWTVICPLMDALDAICLANAAGIQRMDSIIGELNESRSELQQIKGEISGS